MGFFDSFGDKKDRNYWLNRGDSFLKNNSKFREMPKDW
jgi:hypothetical protein